MPGRRLVLVLALTAPVACNAAPDQRAAAPAAAPPSLDVAELSAADARARLEAGTLTSKALTEAYLARIEAMDERGPAVNAVIELNPRAVADAEALDAERTAGKVRGPMHGLPVLLKDNIDVAGIAGRAWWPMPSTARCWPITKTCPNAGWTCAGKRGSMRR